jgi:ABC-type transport system involved in multi-copper enzyme maturation permease subunit
MILWPVIERELRAASRGKHTYRNRFFAALSVIGVSAYIFFTSRWTAMDVMGGEIFEAVSITALLVSLLAGLFYTADCISEERREGTLGLLYLTDLRSGHVALGKLVANSIPSFFALATIVPILGIPFLLGGISGVEMARTALVLLNGLWLSLTAGLFASTLAKDDRVTRLIAFSIMMAAAVIAPMFKIAQTSVFWSWEAARDKIYSRESEQFWIAFGAQFAIGALCVALAAWRARRIWQEKPPTMRSAAAAAKWRIWSAGNEGERKAWRGELLDQNPATWLSCRRRARTALLWAILGIGGIILFWIWEKEGRIDASLGLVASVFFQLLIKGTVALAAGRGLADEARTGALELLLTTGLTPGQLVRGQLAGIWHSFGFAASVVLVADILWVAFGPIETFFASDFRGFLGMRDFFLVLDCVTIAAYGLWLGFKTQRPGRAAVLALVMVVIVPDLLFLLPMGFMRGSSNPYIVAFFVWLLVDVILLALAWMQLSRLRELAAGRFSNSARG